MASPQYDEVIIRIVALGVVYAFASDMRKLFRSQPTQQESTANNWVARLKQRVVLLFGRSKQVVGQAHWRLPVAILLVSMSLLLNALLPRYRIAEIQDGQFIRRFDDWTGEVCTLRLLGTDDEWKKEWRNNPQQSWECAGSRVRRR